MIKLALMLFAAGWTAPVEVHHDDAVAVSYQARLDGPYLVVRATLQPGWHTFAMDNKVRAEEKLAGKKSLGIDHPTEIAVSGGLEAIGPWLQTSPKDFSKPELRWFSWGFEKQAFFAAKVKRKGPSPTRIGLKGQACTETTCKNIDVEISMATGSAKIEGAPAELDLKSLVPVR